MRPRARLVYGVRVPRSVQKAIRSQCFSQRTYRRMRRAERWARWQALLYKKGSREHLDYMTIASLTKVRWNVPGCKDWGIY